MNIGNITYKHGHGGLGPAGIRIQEHAQKDIIRDTNVSSSELSDKEVRIPQTIDLLPKIDPLLDEEAIFSTFEIDDGMIRYSSEDNHRALQKKLCDLFNNPEIDLIYYLIYTIVCGQNEEYKRRALIALSELKNMINSMQPEDSLEISYQIEGLVQSWKKIIPQFSDNQRSDYVQAGLDQMQELGIIQGDCDQNAIASEFLKKNSEALEAIANSENQEAYDILHQSLESLPQDPEEISKLIKGLLNIATDNPASSPEKQMAATCLGGIPGNQDLLSNLSSIFVNWANEFPNEDVPGLVSELNQLDLFNVLKNPNQYSPEDLEDARGMLHKELRNIFDTSEKNLIQALATLAFNLDEITFNLDGFGILDSFEIRENALIALKEISTWEPNLKFAIEALLRAEIKHALDIYEQPRNETGRQSVFSFLERMLRLNIMNPEQNLDILQKINASALSSDINLSCYQDLVQAYLANQLSGIKQQDNDVLTIFNKDIDNRIIDAIFKKLEDPNINEEALDLLCKIFDIYAAQAATAEQSLKGDDDQRSNKPEFPQFITLTENLGGIFAEEPEVPKSEFPRTAEQAIELLMHLTNIFPPNVLEYTINAFDEVTTFLIENTSGDMALYLLEKIVLSKLYVFGEDFEETKSRMEEDFEALRNYSNNAPEYQEALEHIKNGIEQIRKNIANQSQENSPADYQQRLINIHETGQDPHMWHFFTQLYKKTEWPDITNLLDILGNQYENSGNPKILEAFVEIFKHSQDEGICASLATAYERSKDPNILYTLSRIYEIARDQTTCENIRNYLIEQYQALAENEEVTAEGVLELLVRMHSLNPQDPVIHGFLEEQNTIPIPETAWDEEGEEEEEEAEIELGSQTSSRKIDENSGSEEKDQQEMFRSPGASLGASPQPLVEDDTNVPNSMNVPSLKEQEQPKVKRHHHHHQVQGGQPQSFLGNIFDKTVKKAVGLIDYLDPNVNKKGQVQKKEQFQYLSQADFVQTRFRRTRRECGGGGHCMVLSVLCQTNPQEFDNAKDRFEMAIQFRMDLANWAEGNIASQGRQPSQDERTSINALRNIYPNRHGEYLEVNRFIGTCISQYTERPIVVFSTAYNPGVGNLMGDDYHYGMVNYNDPDTEIPENAIVLYHNNEHYQAFI